MIVLLPIRLEAKFLRFEEEEMAPRHFEGFDIALNLLFYLATQCFPENLMVSD
jgi:hypothetical protein